MALELVVGAGLLSLILFIFYLKQTQNITDKLNPPIEEYLFKSLALIGVFIFAFYALGFAYFGSTRVVSEVMANSWANVSLIINATTCSGGVFDPVVGCVGVGVTESNTLTTENVPVLVSSIKNVSSAPTNGEQTLMVSVAILSILCSFTVGMVFFLMLVLRKAGLTK